MNHLVNLSALSALVVYYYIKNNERLSSSKFPGKRNFAFLMEYLEPDYLLMMQAGKSFFRLLRYLMFRLNGFRHTYYPICNIRHRFHFHRRHLLPVHPIPTDSGRAEGLYRGGTRQGLYQQ
jgi:hypothetical protein